MSMVKAALYDVSYDDALQDLTVVAGDIVFVNTHEIILSQLLKDAFESISNSMKHILRNWGFQGRNLDFTTKDNLPKQKTFLYTNEILDRIDFLSKNIQAITDNFTPGGFDGFEFTIEATLDDITATPYNKTLGWDQNTLRATIT